MKFAQWGIHKNHHPFHELCANDMRSAWHINEDSNQDQSVPNHVLDPEAYSISANQKAENRPARLECVVSGTAGPGSPFPISSCRPISSRLRNSTLHPLQFAKSNITYDIMSGSSLETVLVSTKCYSELALGRVIKNEIRPERESRSSNAFSTDYHRTVTRRSWRYTEHIWSKLHRGLSLLEARKFQEGFESLQQGCHLVRDFVSQQSMHRLSSLFIHMGNHHWSRHAEVRRSLLNFLYEMSSAMLGCQHPLSVILCVFYRQDDLINDYAELALKVMLDSANEHDNATHVELLRVKLSFSVVLARQNEHTLSEALIESACSQSEQQSGRTSDEVRQCLRRLANLRASQGRFHEAEAIFEDVIERRTSISNSVSADQLSIYTYRNLAVLCAKRGDPVKSESWYEKELAAALASWGPLDEYYIDCCAMRDVRLHGNALEPAELNWPEIT